MDTQHDLRKIFDLALQHCPVMMTGDISTVTLWVNEGCDVEKDIIPAMRRMFAKNPKINTFKYFTNAVRKSRDSRIEFEQKNIVRTHQSHPEVFARSYAWKKKSGMHLSDAKLAFLERYEKEHGKIEV